MEEAGEVKEIRENGSGGRIAPRGRRPSCPPFVLSKVVTIEGSTGRTFFELYRRTELVQWQKGSFRNCFGGTAVDS